MFHKRNSFSDSSRGTSTQTIINHTTEQCKAEAIEKDSETNSDKESVHSNWSKSIPTEAKINEPQTRKRAIKNIVPVPYKLKPKDWGSWKVKSPYATSIIASPSVNNQKQNNEEMVYVPHSPYYSPVHPLTFYEDE